MLAFVNEGSIPKYIGRVYKMANNIAIHRKNLVFRCINM